MYLINFKYPLNYNSQLPNSPISTRNHIKQTNKNLLLFSKRRDGQKLPDKK